MVSDIDKNAPKWLQILIFSYLVYFVTFVFNLGNPKFFFILAVSMLSTAALSFFLLDTYYETVLSMFSFSSKHLETYRRKVCWKMDDTINNCRCCGNPIVQKELIRRYGPKPKRYGITGRKRSAYCSKKCFKYGNLIYRAGYSSGWTKGLQTGKTRERLLK